MRTLVAQRMHRYEGMPVPRTKSARCADRALQLSLNLVIAPGPLWTLPRLRPSCPRLQRATHHHHLPRGHASRGAADFTFCSLPSAAVSPLRLLTTSCTTSSSRGGGTNFIRCRASWWEPWWRLLSPPDASAPPSPATKWWPGTKGERPRASGCASRPLCYGGSGLVPVQASGCAWPHLGRFVCLSVGFWNLSLA